MPGPGKACVILPTYNEAPNIEAVASAILELGEGFDVLVVDDSSPDGTAELARRVAERSARLKVLQRPRKSGLGSAYMSGFAWALEHDFGAVATMDADLSHDPRALPAMLSLLDEADLVIGSRYVPGGSVVHRGIARNALSRLANYLARVSIASPIRDCTSGYRVYSPALLRRLMSNDLRATGYATLVELIAETARLGGRIAEYPIVFENRLFGTSKMGLEQVLESARTYNRLRLNGAAKHPRPLQMHSNGARANPDASVGIVILNYDGLDDTRACLRALRQQRYRNAHVYVIDNGSRNAEGEILAREFAEVNVTRNQRNEGFGRACNQGIALALQDGARYVMLLNNDAILGPGAIQALVNAMERDETLGIAGARVLNHAPPHTIQTLGYRYNHWTGFPTVVGAGRPPDWTPRRDDLEWIMGCAALVRRQLLEVTGGFDADFFLYWEDVYLCWQARKLGFRVATVDEALVYHRKRLGSEFSLRHIYHMFYGQLKFSAKTTLWYQWPTLIPGLLCIAYGYWLKGLVKQRINAAGVLYAAARDALHNSPRRHVNF